MVKNVATEFDKIINDARERKKNEDLASKIFSKTRRQSAPSKLKATPGASLASRVGVNKKRASIGGAKATPGNVNGEWTHDLHSSVNGINKSKAKTTALGSRITKPGAATPAASNKKKAAATARKAAALERMDVDTVVQEQINIREPKSKGISIRGLAGPFCVMAQNFAPGTTAADIESAMTPIGGEMESCRIIKTKPIMIVEMVFLSREGGEQVIKTFNDKTADGRLIKVYPKIGNQPSSAPTTRRSTRNVADDQIVDGSHGFPEPAQPTLYSDKIVGNNGSGNTNRRSRGNHRGRGGR